MSKHEWKVGDKGLITMDNPWSAGLAKGQEVKVTKVISEETSKIYVEDEHGGTWTIDADAHIKPLTQHATELTRFQLVDNLTTDAAFALVTGLLAQGLDIEPAIAAAVKNAPKLAAALRENS